jgi:hypothetical protein
MGKLRKFGEKMGLIWGGDGGESETCQNRRERSEVHLGESRCGLELVKAVWTDGLSGFACATRVRTA